MYLDINNLDSFNNAINSFSFFNGFGLITLIISCIISLLFIISLWKIFKKAGRNGWEAIVPIYNLYVLLEIGGQKGVLVFFALIPIVGFIIVLIFEIKAIIELSRRFGKSGGFAVLCIFFPFIGFPILAFSNASYEGVVSEPESSILDVNTAGVPENQEFNYGYEKQDTIAMSPVSTEASSSTESVTEVTKTPVENQASEVIEPSAPAVPEVPVQEVAETVEEATSQVDRFHTSSALDNKDNNQN